MSQWIVDADVYSVADNGTIMQIMIQAWTFLEMFFEAAEETGTRVDGVDTQNTRLEVQHNFKEMASQRAT